MIGVMAMLPCQSKCPSYREGCHKTCPQWRQFQAEQQAQQEQAASQRTPASGGNAQTPVQASVYIAASGNGTKYHSDPHCSRMNGVIEMSVEEAQAMGYTPCKKCY